MVAPLGKKITVSLLSMVNIFKKQKIHNEIHKIGNNLSLKQMRQSEDRVNRKKKPGMFQ